MHTYVSECAREPICIPSVCGRSCFNRLAFLRGQADLQEFRLVCALPRLRLSPNIEPSSTVVSLEWLDVQPAIGTKVSDYILQHKKVDEYTDTDLYTGR